MSFFETPDRYVEKTKTWQDRWNDVIRHVLFQDDVLKNLMLVPEGTDILTFQKKYFIRDGSTDELLTNEKVRVVCYDEQGSATWNPNVRVKYKNFDIFVKEDVEHTADIDRLKSRQILVAERIKYLLLRHQYCEQLRFHYEDEYDQWTKTVGYKMYKLTMWYKTTT